jgi:hypothetical protein
MAPAPLSDIDILDTFCGVLNICGKEADVEQMAAGIAKYSIKNPQYYFIIYLYSVSFYIL